MNGESNLKGQIQAEETWGEKSQSVSILSYQVEGLVLIGSSRYSDIIKAVSQEN